MGGAGGDSDDAARKPGDVDRGRAVGLRPVAERAVVIVAPALDPASARERAGVGAAGGDGGDAAGKPGGGDGGQAGAGRRVAELAVVVVAPALDPACARERTAVVDARGDGGDAACKPGDVDRSESGARRPVTELAVVVVSPALDPACARERAGVGAASCGDGGDAA